MTEIIPAVLPESFEELSEELGEVAHFARAAHIDVCDGMFVPHVSWPYGDTDDGHFVSIQKEGEGLPFWEKLDFEAHLMVMHPERLVSSWIRAGVARVIVQAEAVTNKEALIKVIGEMTELGIALKLETPLDTFMPFVGSVQTLHLMTIARIGYQGEEFQESAIKRVREAHRRFPDIVISVDGGVGVENASELIDAGASRLIVGSALFESENITKTYREIQEVANGVQ